ncbi:MAG TPA: NAD-dependent epimerase/dehydratase family protein [Opitutus sp.]|nr:NAD-dependent epimerase/dehydratase family protein [Opitutus sp.]
MSKRILITGGAGFIGSHLADELLRAGHDVRVLDPLSPQVHGENAQRPEYLHPDVRLLRGCVEDAELIADALVGVDAVYHLAAKVGVGQSMYDINGYTTTNNAGTAVLLEALLRHPVERLVVASSMSIYGEGLYRDSAGRLVPGGTRSLDQLKAREWELRDEFGFPLTPVPTPETKEPALASVYALSKFDQERMCLLVGRAYGIPTVALRFFNVYGPRQSLSNPYTGVLAIFASQLLNNQPPIIFEDGQQRRDFVNVRDIARACHLALEAPGAADQVFNIGSGRNFSVSEIASRLAQILGKNIEPEITHRYRVGDIRHCFSDISAARRVLGYTPQVTFEQGLEELAGWLEGRIVTNNFEEARNELAARGLTV